MNWMVLGALAALLMVSAGLFWWQGRAELARSLPPPDISGEAPDGTKPKADDTPIELPTANPHERGARLPSAGKPKLSNEEKRFNRYDKNRDGRVTRNEILSTRVKAFQKLDTNHDNMLSFEEWAVKTSDRFKDMDSNHDGVITPAELAAYDTVMDAKKKHRKACGGDKTGAEKSEGDPGDPAP